MSDIEIHIAGNSAKILGNIPDAVVADLYAKCSFYVQGSEHSALFKKGRWDGHTHLFKHRYNIFPAGLVNMVSNALMILGYRINVTYGKYHHNVITPTLELSDTVEMRWYAIAAVESALAAKRCIIKVATGGGKTVIAAMLIQRIGERTLFLVHTKDLMRQAKDAFETFLGIKCGQIGDGVLETADVTVATIQTISLVLDKKYKSDAFCEENDTDDTKVEDNQKEAIRAWLKGVNVLLQDEAHRVASEVAFEVANAIKNASWRVGFSASPWRDDGTDMMIDAAYGHRAFDITASELIRMGYLMKPTIEFRHIISPQPSGTYEQVYGDWVVNNPFHNLSIVNDVQSMYEDNRTILVLVKQIKHGKMLMKSIRDRNIPCQFLSGKDSSSVRYETINDLRNRNLPCLVATTIADEGLDIKPIDGMILAGRGKSSTRALQRIGRALRPYDKKAPLIIDYYDQVRYLEEHAQKRITMYRTEPEFTIKVERAY